MSPERPTPEPGPRQGAADARDERCAPIESALADYVRRADAPSERAADPCGFFARHGVPEGDARALASPTLERRFALYRELVHARIAGAVEATLPRTAASLEQARLEREVAAFLEQAPSPSPYLRELVVDFVAFASPRLAADATLPPHLVDLARFELAHVEIAAGPDDEPHEARDPSADAPVRVQRAARLDRLGHAVHRLAADATEAPERGDFRLLGYRDAEGHTRLLELSALAAVLVDRLRSGALLGEAVREACAEVGRACDDAALAEIAALLDELAERGVLLGAG